jgi:signal transduction histidine kinase
MRPVQAWVEGGRKRRWKMDSSRSILYIEDNPASFRLAERILRDEGFQVFHARDGFEGVKRAIEERGRLDLILVDINLPGMDGYEAATKLKTIAGFEQIPIVALTANTLKGDRKRSLAAGCDGYIAKPISINVFPDQIKEYIRGKRERIQAEDETYYLREHNRKLVDRLETSLGELQLTHERIRHKDKLASLGEMAAGIAHELNNPLSSISFAIQLLLREVPPDNRQRRHLDLIHRNIEKIQRLAEGLTSFARPSDTEHCAVELPKLLEEILFLSDYEFRSRDIRVVRRIEQPLPQVWANESQLHHVFMNLLRNAAQAVEVKQGTQDPRSPRQELGEVTIEAQAVGARYVCVGIADNGIGIHPDYEDRLFTPFFTTKPRGQGTGLGLYIVKQILDDLDGRIEVRSTLGRGTTFQIFLPRISDERSVG